MQNVLLIIIIVIMLQMWKGEPYPTWLESDPNAPWRLWVVENFEELAAFVVMFGFAAFAVYLVVAIIWDNVKRWRQPKDEFDV